jgi:hypothetical protein
MEKESVLLNKPEGVTLIEYFNSLNVFDKRTLIDELSDAKLNVDTSVKYTMPYFVLTIVASIVGISFYPTTLSFAYFGLLTGVLGYMVFKKLKTSFQFKAVIDHMTSNM